MQKWYEEIFENYADGYDREIFTQGTIGEVDFIEAEIGADRKKRILDIGCGTGRHSIELARRGYDITGLDLSETLLGKARAKAAEAGVEVEFIRADARDFGSTVLSILHHDLRGCFPAHGDRRNELPDSGEYRPRSEARRQVHFHDTQRALPLFHSVKDFLNRGRSEERGQHLRPHDVPGSFPALNRRRRRPGEGPCLRRAILHALRDHLAPRVPWLPDDRHPRGDARKVQPGRRPDDGRLRDARHRGKVAAGFSAAGRGLA